MQVFHTAHLRVRPQVVAQFKSRLVRHARISTMQEHGCERCDVHPERDDPTRFLLIESYVDQAAFELHRSSPHYVAFRADIKEWVVERTWWHWNPLACDAE